MSCQLHALIHYHRVREQRLYLCSLGWKDLRFTELIQVNSLLVGLLGGGDEFFPTF
jgi:hypothetical protein